MCVSSFYNSFDCYSADIIQISRPSYPNENPEGPFYPGEEVEFCFEIQFYVSAPPPPNGNNCQWIQGIIPSLSDAWDYEGSNLSAQGPVGSWFWLDEDNVDYNVNSNIYSIKTVDGRKYMEYGGQNAGMPDGTTLPGDGGLFLMLHLLRVPTMVILIICGVFLRLVMLRLYLIFVLI